LPVIASGITGTACIAVVTADVETPDARRHLPGRLGLAAIVGADGKRRGVEEANSWLENGVRGGALKASREADGVARRSICGAASHHHKRTQGSL
jgi:hypothetical protein